MNLGAASGKPQEDLTTEITEAHRGFLSALCDLCGEVVFLSSHDLRVDKPPNTEFTETLSSQC